jgi:hypothetical protein
LQERLDKCEYPLRAAEDIAGLRPEEQEMINNVLRDDKYHLDMEKSKHFKSPWRSVETGLMTEDNMRELLEDDKPAKKSVNVRIRQSVILKRFDNDESADEISDTIAKALQAWFANNENTSVESGVSNNG